MGLYLIFVHIKDCHFLETKNKSAVSNGPTTVPMVHRYIIYITLQYIYNHVVHS